MDHLQTRLEALEQQMHTVNRRLRWWRGLACGVVVLAALTWALPAVIAQEEEAKGKGQKGLAHRVAALEKLLKHFSREKNEIFITGANLHLVNGLGQTGCGSPEEPIPDCPNALGNLIVSYNESRADPGDPDVRTGSHNVVVGQGHNFSRFGGLVVGYRNTISGDFASVSGGGEFNGASGFAAAVRGGERNTASGHHSSVSGGRSNTASGFYEWKAEGRDKTPYDIHPEGQPYLACAGLYDVWITPRGEELSTCTIITTEADPFMARLHHRMPVVLARELEDEWLDPAMTSAREVLGLLERSAGLPLDAYPVSRMVNKPSVDGQELIRPIE
jgi:SOS response associated peptidase (SRAP)